SVSIAADHDGYRRLAGRNQHVRQWVLREHALDIEDQVSGAYSSAVAYLHLHPDVAALVTGCDVQLQLAAAPFARITFEHADAVELEPSTWQPSFGTRVPNLRIVARFRGGRLLTRVRWGRSP
ncbi:MAG TPA: heparinase II/III family protein, partial [Steroidobacteraceae bacterium]|nr:heparinase II/III family protein [Steroidobacteraceae bacterium]